MKRSFVPGLLLLLGANAAGCATTQALHTDASTSAIRSAEEGGAPAVPQAALHLQLAKEELQAATVLNTNHEPDEAKSLLLRAEADAELAVALSKVESEKTEAEAAMARVRQLQTDNPYAPGSAK